MNLNQVTLSSKNVEESVAFYKKLGLQLIVDSIPRYARFECPKGESTFSLHHSEESNSNSSWIYFECDNLDSIYQDLLEAGIAFDHSPKDQDWLWREARLKAPDGHQIILYHAGENRKNPPWRIKTES